MDHGTCQYWVAPGCTNKSTKQYASAWLCRSCYKKAKEQSRAIEYAHRLRERVGPVAVQLVTLLKRAPEFGGEPKTAFGRQYLEWVEQVRSIVAEVEPTEYLPL